MADSVTEVTSQSWFARLRAALGGVLVVACGIGYAIRGYAGKTSAAAAAVRP